VPGSGRAGLGSVAIGVIFIAAHRIDPLQISVEESEIVNKVSARGVIYPDVVFAVGHVAPVNRVTAFFGHQAKMVADTDNATITTVTGDVAALRREIDHSITGGAHRYAAPHHQEYSDDQRGIFHGNLRLPEMGVKFSGLRDLKIGVGRPRKI
jgi:hypothetical protein